MVYDKFIEEMEKELLLAYIPIRDLITLFFYYEKMESGLLDIDEYEAFLKMIKTRNNVRRQ